MSTEVVGIDALITVGHTREAWSKIQVWYRQAKLHLTPPTREGLEHTSDLREELYRWRPP